MILTSGPLFQSLKNIWSLLATLELELAGMVLILREEHKNSVQKSSLNEEPYFVKLDTDIQKVHTMKTTKTTVKYQCPGFKISRIWALAITVAFTINNLNIFLKQWQPNISQIFPDAVPSCPGRKKMKQNGKENQHKSRYSPIHRS